MREVAAGVYEIAVLRGFVNAFLVVGDTLILVDAGLPGRAGEVRAAVERLGRGPREIRTIAVTHHHVDHVGALADLQRLSGATVCASAPEAEIIAGRRSVPRLVARSAHWSVLLAVAERLGPTRAKPVQAQVLVGDGQVLEGSGLTAILTPGHTMGHVSYLHPATGTLFVGDAAALTPRGNLAFPVGDHDEDPTATRASIAKLSKLDFKVACFGHGRAIRKEGAQRFQEFAERQAR